MVISVVLINPLDSIFNVYMCKCVQMLYSRGVDDVYERKREKSRWILFAWVKIFPLYQDDRHARLVNHMV